MMIRVRLRGCAFMDCHGILWIPRRQEARHQERMDMIIRNTPEGDIEFWISIEDAKRVIIDHGEGQICLPVADTLEAVLAVGSALRGELTEGNEAVIEELPP